MAFIRRRTINGKTRYYLEKSVRIINGKVKKISVYLKSYDPKKKGYPLQQYEKTLYEKLNLKQIESCVSQYEKNHVFNAGTLHDIEEAKIGFKEICKKLTKKQLDDIIDRFTINFTYESNAIEGNSLTLKDVTFIIKEGKILQGKDLREVYETLNTRKAFDWIFKNNIAINETNIIKLHKILMENTGVATGYKQFPNFLLGRNVKTTQPENVQKEMQNLLEGYHQHKRLHPLQRAAHAHGVFEKIHPFEDGNGRTGRLLIAIMLLSEGYPPVIIRKTNRIAYFHTLESFDKGYKEALYRFLIEKFKKTYHQFFEVYIKYLNS